MIEQILETEVDEAKAREAGTFQHLGNNLSALSFLVDMLHYQPALAKRLFVFDDDLGELKPLMGRHARPADVSPALAEAQAVTQGVNQGVPTWRHSASNSVTWPTRPLSPISPTWLVRPARPRRPWPWTRRLGRWRWSNWRKPPPPARTRCAPG